MKPVTLDRTAAGALQYLFYRSDIRLSQVQLAILKKLRNSGLEYAALGSPLMVGNKPAVVIDDEIVVQFIVETIEKAIEQIPPVFAIPLADTLDALKGALDDGVN